MQEKREKAHFWCAFSWWTAPAACIAALCINSAKHLSTRFWRYLLYLASGEVVFVAVADDDDVLFLEEFDG